MPRFFEANTANEVLCYIPSGKIIDGQQKLQFSQDGDTCWFYSTKRLANATGFQLDSTEQRYRLISDFRKTQSKLDACVQIAAALIAKNCPSDGVYIVAKSTILMQRAICKIYKLSPKLTQKILDNVNPKGVFLPRQLKDLENDAKFIQECVERYRKYNPGLITSYNTEILETIVKWLKTRNPYQSQLLECACNIADGLSKLSSDEFPVYPCWSQEPRKLIAQTTSTPFQVDPFASLFSATKPSVIILGPVPTDTTSSLTVAEKQEKRRLALAEFNHKIRRETLDIFRMRPTTFDTPEELMDRLKKYGPLIMNGYYGENYYNSAAQGLKDQDGHHQTFGTRQVVGWKQGEVKVTDNIDLCEEHQITIIGLKYDSENPQRSQVIFQDPKDASFPNEQRKAYRMSFDRLSINRSLASRGSFQAHYSTSDNLPERIYKHETEEAQISTARKLLKYGVFAFVGAVSVYAGYHAIKPGGAC